MPLLGSFQDLLEVMLTFPSHVHEGRSGSGSRTPRPTFCQLEVSKRCTILFCLPSSSNRELRLGSEHLVFNINASAGLPSGLVENKAKQFILKR